MASKSRACLFSTLPPLAKWLRQIGVATVIAASFLLLAAEASAQAPLVTIQTRVVTKNSPNPYSTLVGTATYGATGAGPGYHVVALNRTTLALVSNNTYGLDFTSIFQMNLDIFGLSSSSLVIISSMDPATSFSFQAASYLDGVAANLGGTGQGYIYGGGPVSPSAYSLIGVPGLGAAGGSANQVSTYADPDTNGNISGVLIPDVNGNYAFTYSQFVKVQTITGPKNDTITIGPVVGTKPKKPASSFEAPPLAGGANGGFHVLIVKRATLNQIATDPTVVILHSSYATNASDASLAASETHRMASDLNRFPNGLQTGNLIFIIASLGCNPGFNFSSASVTDIATIVGIINGQLGGAGDLENLGSNGYYSIIGIPNATGTLSPEVRSWATPQLSGNITAVLQQNNVGLFTPLNVSAVAGVTLDLSLLPTALATPVPWPLVANGSTCSPTDQFCAAYKWISCQLIFANPVDCTNEDIRGTKYIDLTFSLSTALSKLSTLAYPSQPTTQPPGFSFSRKAFNQVQEQLETEIQFAMDVQSWFKNVQDVINDLALSGDLSLQTAINTVQSDVQLPQSTQLPFNVVGVIRDAVMVATIVAGAVQPELVPALSLASAGIYLEMQFNNAPSGANGNQFVTEESNLFNQIQTAFNSAKYGNGILETIVLTDWNKLQTIGTNIENASSSSSAWFFGPTTEGDIVNAATNAYKVSFYQGLMAAKYQMVNFFGVPFSDPSSYNYNFDCQTSMGVRFCVCSGQVYSPPSGAWSNFGSGPYNISMAVSPNDGSYPSNTLTTKLFTTMHLYSQDFFFTVRGWSGIQNALPQGWSDYQNNGACLSSPAPAARRQAHGQPGPVLAHRPFRPFMALAANAKKPKPKPPPGSCGPGRF